MRGQTSTYRWLRALNFEFIQAAYTRRNIGNGVFCHASVLPFSNFSLTYISGEEVAVWVQLKPGAQMTEENLKALCKGKVGYVLTRDPQLLVFPLKCIRGKYYPTLVQS